MADVGLEPVSGDPFAPGGMLDQQPAVPPYSLAGAASLPLGVQPRGHDTIAPYTPDLTERITDWMRGNASAGSERATVAGKLGATLDLTTPVGAVSGMQDAAARHDPQAFSLAALGILPGAGALERGAGKVAGAVEREGARAISAVPVSGDPFAPPETWYHGSSAPLDGTLDPSKIGSGASGAYASGFGGNFADIHAQQLQSQPLVYLTNQEDHAKSFGDHISKFTFNGNDPHYHNIELSFSEWANENGYDNPQKMINDYYGGDLYEATNADAVFREKAAEAQAQGKNSAIIDFGKLEFGDGRRAGKVLVTSDPSTLSP